MFLESSPGFQQSTTIKNLKQVVLTAVVTALGFLLAACSGIFPSTPSQSSGSTRSPVKVNVSPATATIVSGGTQQFSATLTSTSNTGVLWKATAGTISNQGLYTAPSVTSSTKVTVTATSVADGSSIATSQVTVSPWVKLGIGVRSLPGGTVGTPYSTSLSATGGTAPYRWVINGTLPSGLTLNPTTGVISGTTSQSGTFSFTASVTDSLAASASTSLSLAISSVTTGGSYDGPAELPRVYVQSALANTPAPGSVISVPSGGDFQQALNSVKCGQTIELQSGAVFTGSYTVPAQTCDDAHWIIVRTSAPDSSLPPEGTRISPCYAGVTSLPGRPALNCTSTSNVLAKIQFSGTGSGPITLQNGASHYRFIGLEITRVPSTGVVYNLAVRDKNGVIDHVIFDRSWLHGTAQDETQRGVMLSGMTYSAIVDSYFSDFHCIAKTGACVDSQAIAGGLGDNQMGPYKIVDNFLEAASENILFGGGEATMTPADIEIRRNHMFKPLMWMAGQPGFVGGRDGNAFIVKNLFELKNAQRVLFEGNVLEYSWGGFSQEGFAIGMGPKNQAKNGLGVCPLCQVTDITIRYVKIRHVGGGLQLGNGDSDIGGVALAGGRYSVHDLTAEDINGTTYSGYGDFAQVSTGKGAPILHDVTINHVTAFQPGIMLNIGDDITINQPMNNFVYTNNITNAGTAPTKTTGGNGSANCAFQNTPIIVLPKCFLQYTFSTNAIVATPSNYPPAQYPVGNYFPASAAVVDFVNYNNGIGGDYHLTSSSPYKNKGTDGKDLGADVDALDTTTAGVE
ncbi:MAG TPA: putative Ig domain-containing protein [Candidatus Dormibacteraeota bacterium]|nr:putative Ig domain-containing protein [Candidatus Dormibacteraeota bacterium]